MSRSRDEAADEVARVQVQLAAAAAGATPLAELDPTARDGTVHDLSRVRPLLEQLAGAVARLLGTDIAAVWVTDPAENVLAASAWVGFPDDYIGALRVPFGTGSAGRAVSERRIIHVEDIAASAHYDAYRAGAFEHGVRAALSVPMLTVAGEPMGALSAYYREIVVPDDSDLELVELYARQAAEIVERARLHSAARQLAALERRRAVQLRALAGSALALTAADSLPDLLRLVTDAAMEVVGCHQAVTSRLPTSGWADSSTYVSLSEKYAAWRGYRVVPEGRGVLESVIRDNSPLRLTAEQLSAHPDWRGLADAPGHPPLPDYLGVPLVGRDGANLGIVQLSDKLDGTPFTAEDEAILVQLAQMASATVERLEAFEGERAARREAQRAAALQSLLSEASAVFAESFDPQGIATALCELVVPRLAQVSLLHLVDDSGDLVLESCHTADDAALARVRAFFGAAPVLLDVPYGPAAVLATGQPQHLSPTTPEMLRAATRSHAQAEELGQVLGSSCLCVPLPARGRTLGVLTLSRTEAYDDADVEHALDLARRAGLALDNANRYAFERDMALTLQRSLLPRRLPTGAAFRAAARYLPGARGTYIGGDWYDVIEVGDTLVLVIGDVMGRGVQAAAVMGQLQATVRAYALEGHSPAEILTRLDRVVLAAEDPHFTTCIVGRLDLTTWRLCLASAGHLPPVLIGPEGRPRLLELDPGLPLGVGGAQFVEQHDDLAPGSLLLLYTDGLVECRHASLDAGLDRLVAALVDPVISPDQACDRVLRALGRDGGHDDDTALLSLLVATPPDLHLTLPTLPTSGKLARYAVRDLLGARGLDSEVAQLLVAELVANAARHAGSGQTDVRVTLNGDLVRVEVDDDSGQLPGELREPRWQQESGRGLFMVEALSDRWGAETLPTGKRVWFELTPVRTR